MLLLADRLPSHFAFVLNNKLVKYEERRSVNPLGRCQEQKGPVNAVVGCARPSAISVAPTSLPSTSTVLSVWPSASVPWRKTKISPLLSSFISLSRAASAVLVAQAIWVAGGLIVLSRMNSPPYQKVLPSTTQLRCFSSSQSG